jgi:predicted nucleic acid-binding protein
MSFMSDKVFLDTNILVYAFDADDPTRQHLAASLLEKHLTDHTAVLSLQVLQEFFVVMTRKVKTPMEPGKARRLVADFLRHDVVEPTSVHLLKAMDLSIGQRFSFWDSLVIVTALEAGCKRLYSEDLKHNLTLEGLTIMNPFKH